MSRICDLVGKEVVFDHASYSVAPEDLGFVIDLFLQLGFTKVRDISAEWGRGIFVADAKGNEFQFNGRQDVNLSSHPGDHPAVCVQTPSLWSDQVTNWLKARGRTCRTVLSGSNILVFIDGIPWGIEFVCL
jgi:hypothetical protein